jgi:hypothetical protein
MRDEGIITFILFCPIDFICSSRQALWSGVSRGVGTRIAFVVIFCVQLEMLNAIAKSSNKGNRSNELGCR